LWSFVKRRVNKVWIWLALCRRTRQIVAYYCGDRSEKGCRQLWARIPSQYKQGSTYSDYYATYEKVITTGKHQSVGKDSGQTNHVERFNNTLRQRLGRLVRETLSFSKLEENHELCLEQFICRYNTSVRSA
jgi:insertion element IS1 protein InsB